MVRYILICTLCLTSLLQAQDRKSVNGPMAAHMSYGMSLEYRSFNGYIDRLYSTPHNFSLYLRGGGGYRSYYGYMVDVPFYQENIYAFVQGGIITAAQRTHHFEFGLGQGVHLIHARDITEFLFLQSTIGYRYQRPQGKVVVRAGISLPEGAYLSLGLTL